MKECGALRRPWWEFIRRRRRLVCCVAGTPGARSGRNAISRGVLDEWNKGVEVAGTRIQPWPCLERRATCLVSPLLEGSKRSRNQIGGMIARRAARGQRTNVQIGSRRNACLKHQGVAALKHVPGVQTRPGCGVEGLCE